MIKTDNVSKKLIEDAESKKQEILLKANQKASSILKEADERKKAIMTGGKILADEAYKHEYDFIIAQFNSQLNQKLLTEKIKIVEDVVKIIINRLENIDIADLKKALIKFAGNINVKNGVYQIGINEKRITDAVISEVFESISLTKSEKKPSFDNGIKIIDGRKEYYFSEKNLIDAEAEETKMEISKLLFD